LTLWGLAVSKLRWTLLILGGAFILALALWERWRPRHARGPAARQRAGAGNGLVGDDLTIRSGTDPSEAMLADPEEPWIGEPCLADALLSPTADPGQNRLERSWTAPGSSPEEASAGVGRAAAAGATMAEPHRDAHRGELPGRERPATDDRSRSGSQGGAPRQSAPCGGEATAAQREDRTFEIRGPEAAGDGRPEARGEPLLAPAALDAAAHFSAGESLRVVRAEELDEFPTAELPVLAEAAVDVPASQALEETAALEGLRPVAPIVQWPPETSRQIVALRLLAPPERFAGRAVRLALAAEGFRLGEFDIFHKPDETHRALVSAASLTRPGTFDLDTMDSQRYAGLNLFVVLPGPHPGQRMFDELVDAALNLCERLQGELQDARGEALTGESIELLRDTLFSGAGGEGAL
jgi:hypothetical protein